MDSTSSASELPERTGCFDEANVSVEVGIAKQKQASRLKPDP
jgi:hypothetical protein